MAGTWGKADRRCALVTASGTMRPLCRNGCAAVGESMARSRLPPARSLVNGATPR